MKYLPILLIIISGLLISGCRKDKMDTEIVIVDPKGTTIDTEFKIWVTDVNNTPLVEVEIELGTEKITTDENGIAWINKINLDSEGSRVKLTKSGYFQSFKRVIPLTDKKTYLQVTLIKKEMPSGTFTSEIGGVVKGSKGEAVTFSPNSIIVDGSKANYSGVVKVYTHHFSPTDYITYSSMPGNLTGIDKSGNLVALETFGMLLVELEGKDGEKLNLKDGFTAEIKLPIPSEVSAAPSEIPLWSMNESNGLWVEEEIASKVDGYYIGEVSHFSFWNCDAPYPLITLSGTLVSGPGQILPYTQIIISTPSGVSGVGVTNDLGFFMGKVPKGIELTLEIVDQCQSLSSKIDIGSFNMDTNIGEVDLNLPAPTQITGMLVSCSGPAVENGYLVVEISENIKAILPVVNGHIDATLSLCGQTEVTITGFDLDNLLQTPSTLYTITGPTLNIGTLTTCDELAEFISVTFDQGGLLLTDVTALSMSAIVQGDHLVVGAGNGLDFISFEIDGITEGIHELSSLIISPEFSPTYGCGTTSPGPCPGIINAEITTFGDIGEIVAGTMTGQVYLNQNLVDVTVEFKLKLDDKKEEVSGVIWSDANNNGIRESNEALLKGIKLSVSSGSVTSTFVTKEDGKYSHFVSTQYPFDIKIVGSNFQFSPQDVGSDDTKDSDFDSSGQLFSQVIVLGNPIEYLDCGISILPVCNFTTHPSNCAIQGATLEVGFENTLPGSQFGYVLSAAHPDFPITFSTSANPLYISDLYLGLEITVVGSINGLTVCSEVFKMPQPTNMIKGSKTFSTSCSPPKGEILLDIKDFLFGQDFTYEWSNGSTSQNLTNATSGSYELKVQDKVGCQEFLTIVADFESTRAIGGFVWRERGIALDHIYSLQDELLDDIQINLLDQNGTFLESTVTGYNGKYQFDGLNESTGYIIEIPLGQGMGLALVNQDIGNEETDSDGNVNTGRTDIITVGPACFVNNYVSFGLD